MHNQEPQTAPCVEANDAHLQDARPKLCKFVGRRLKVLNLCQSDEELNHGVDFFGWHGAMTRAKREAGIA